MKQHNIVIKFNKNAIQSRNNQELILKPYTTQDNFLNQFTYRSIISDEMLSPQRKINTVNFENLVGICYVQGLNKMSVQEKEKLAKKMDAYDFVEYAYLETSQEMNLPLSLEIKNQETSIDKKSDKTPDFTHLQTYKEGIEKDHIGIDMEYAWSIELTGEGIQLADIESNFNPKHINLKRDSIKTLIPDSRDDNSDHGTAVTGILYANDVGFGIKGMVHGADAYYFVSSIPLGVVAAIVKVLEVLNAGDVFVYELQTGGPTSQYVPADYDKAVWDVTQEALKANIFVVAAAGNGDADLDREEFDEYRSRPDNGIIRVGAGDKLLNKAAFSTYGSMIHLQAWGGGVATTGFGDLYNGGPNNNYTATFSGTSSATPIVASAVVAIQSWYSQQTDGDILTPLEMRELLIKTGIPQCREWWKSPSEPLLHIGPLPNIRNAINELRERFSPSIVRAIVEGPVVIYADRKVTLSAKKSKSNAADIASYDWQLPDGITADVLDQSTLTFVTPELTESQKFLINLTVTDDLGNSNNTTHTMIILSLPEYQPWKPRKVYHVGDIVSWKNKIWIAKIDNIEIEPGTNDEIWEELG